MLGPGHGRLVGMSRVAWSWEVRLHSGTESRVLLLGGRTGRLGAAGALGARDLPCELDDVVGDVGVSVDPGLAGVLGHLGLVQRDRRCAEVGLVAAGSAEARLGLEKGAVNRAEELVGYGDGRFGLEL